MATPSRPRLGELLVRAGVVTPEQADAAAAVHRANDRTIGQQLLADGAVTELDLAAALSYQLDVPFVLLGSHPIDEVAVHLTPPDLARGHRLVVVGARDGELLVAMERPTDLRAREALAARTGRRVVPLLALASDLEREIERRFAEPPEEAAPTSVDAMGAPPTTATNEPTTGASPAPVPPAPETIAAAAIPPAEAARGPSGELVPFPRAGPRAGEAPPAAAPVEPARAPEPVREEASVREGAGGEAQVGEDRSGEEPAREEPPLIERGSEAAAERVAAETGRATAARAPIGIGRARAEGPEAQILRFLLAQAVRERAADIHLEPLADRLRVRFRVEGALKEVSQLPRDMAAAVAARVRALAGMASSERQGQLVMRDDSADAPGGTREARFDVSAVPTLWGEKIVLRVIERQTAAPELEGLGMEPGTLERWRELLRSPYGLLLVAGMPGMGKTTTLYASARELPSTTKDITTVEDPVAFALEGVNQVPVDRAAGGSYAATLRAVLAQGPDIVLVGELRDRETAETAMNAALAGRLVLTSLQAPDALAAVHRLTGLGADPYLVSASLVAVLAQLLVPRLCEHCRAPSTPAMIESALLRQAGLPSDRVFVARGCARCAGTGYRGRVGVFELLIPNEELRSAIERGAPLEEAREISARAGIVPLREAGLRLVSEGLTSTQELMTRLPASG
jgi:type IV pilus assembly protein PilB